MEWGKRIIIIIAYYSELKDDLPSLAIIVRAQ